MKKKLYPSFFSFNIKSAFKKFIVLAVSIAFISLNVGVSYAQTTEGDDVIEETEEDDSTSLADVIENAEAEQPEEEVVEETPQSSGGSSAGAILGLVAVGALVAIVLSSRNKNQSNDKAAPKIQKTFVSDQVSGKGGWLVDISTADQLSLQSNLSEMETLGLDRVSQESHYHDSDSALPDFSFQYGSYESINGLSDPYTFINTRLSSKPGSSLTINADVGIRLDVTQEDVSLLEHTQWLSLGLSKKSFLTKNDNLQISANYVQGDDETSVFNDIAQGLAWQQYSSIFSQQNSGLQLAYSRHLGQNLNWQIMLQKPASMDSDYAAKLAWRYNF